MRLPPCLIDGVICGAVAGTLGGLPSVLLLSLPQLDESIKAVAHLVPGNARVSSPWGRRALGAAAHMGLSVGLACVYACSVRTRPVLYGTAFGRPTSRYWRLQTFGHKIGVTRWPTT